MSAKLDIFLSFRQYWVEPTTYYFDTIWIF